MRHYLDAILPHIHKVSKEIYFRLFKINNKDLSNIIKVSANCDRLILRGATIVNCGNIDFGKDLAYKIRFISFENTGRQEYSNWKKNKIQYNQIIDAIKNSGLFNSLNSLCLYESGVDISEANLPSRIKIINQLHDPI